jgi:homocitrate synthase
MTLHFFSSNPTPSLDEFGVEYIELTSPAASPESFNDCKTICSLGLKRSKCVWSSLHLFFGARNLKTDQFPLLPRVHHRILTHIRCHMDDAKLAVETGVDGVDIVIGTSSFLREHSHGKDMTWITKS